MIKALKINNCQSQRVWTKEYRQKSPDKRVKTKDSSLANESLQTSPYKGVRTKIRDKKVLAKVYGKKSLDTRVLTKESRQKSPDCSFH